MSPERESQFDEFVAARYAALRRTGYLLCGDWHRAEDLVQATLIKLYARWSRLRDPQSAAGYARTTLTRTYIDGRRRRSSGELTGLDLPEQAAAGPDSDRRLALLAALAQVSPRYRAVLVLRYWEDQSIEETSAILGVSTGAVRSDAHRGLAQLRAILGESLSDIAAI
ncbi:SigE family RNA polymerase sigma factor [Kitasatospora sp. NPDC050463]|uniref:SigE family RNA polymerase sigma factor n=1 Tax=Kitasatospora sp. NPDC050463 TaxID=3155786 RepID=UPI003410EBC8